jgi:beta-galactosidase
MMATRREFLKAGSSVAAVAMLPGTMQAAIATMLKNAPENVTRLSDGWEFLKGTMGGPWEIWHSKETAVWSPVAMPHSFNWYDGCDPDVPYYMGNGWYRSHVAIANPYKNGRTLLHFEGAGQTAAVYVGETLVGKHEGGYDEFVVDITDAVAALPATSKDVPIAVLCDNSRDLDRIPSDLSDFSLYGGMYRHLNLVYVPFVSLSNLHVKTEISSPTGPADITILGNAYTGPYNGLLDVHFSLEVTDPENKVVHTASGRFNMNDDEVLSSFKLAKPRLWHPKTPHLYRCKVTLHSDSGDYVGQESFGVKHTEFIEHGPLILNGERYLLNGTHRHEDHANYANAMPDDLIEQEMKLIKAMGANFIRLAHYQQSRRVLELCDRLGILVWEEIPWCRGGIGDDAFKNMCRAKLTNMIGQHFNHASVIFWGLGNEDDWPTEYPEVNKPAIRAFMSELNVLAHQLDSSRHTSFRRCDFADDIPDVYSPSIWAGWYSGTYPEYQKSLEKWRDKVNHFIHIEWGADSHAGRHSENPDKALANIATGHGTAETGLVYLNTGGPARVSKDGDWSETYACNLFDWHLKVQQTLPWFVGSAMWIFKDFTTPLRVENPVPRINQKGVIQRDMTMKEGYYVFQSYWSEEPMAHIYGHTWPVRWGDAGESKMVKVYSNCETAEMFWNGKSLGEKKRDAQDFPAAGLRWMTPFAEGKNELRVVAKKGGKTVTDEISFVYQTEKWDAPAELRLAIVNRDARTVTLETKLYDAKGVLCLDAKNVVRFSVAGHAKMIDNMGTSHGSRVVQLYNGRAVISLEPGEGKSVVAVQSEGVQTVTVEV